MAKRNLRHPFLEVFDQPDTQTSCFHRESSTHAPQALEMLNGPLANRLAEHLAGRLQREAGNQRQAQVRWAFQLTSGRLPTPQEEKLSLEFLAHNSLREFALACLNLNAFLYVD